MTKLSKVEHAIEKLVKVTAKPQPISITSTELDEVSAFGSYVVAQLQALPPRSRLILQDKMKSLITKERLKIIVSPDPSPMLSAASWLYVGYMKKMMTMSIAIHCT